MSHARHGLKALGLCLIAALGLIALSATVAQAATFDVEGVKITENTKIKAESDSIHYLLLVPGQNLEILCKIFELDEGIIKPDGTSLGDLLYKECSAYSITPTLTKLPCWVEDEVNKILNEIHVKVEDKLIVHEKDVYDLFFPHGGGATFVNLLFLGAECIVPEKVAITGSVVVKDCKNLDLSIPAVFHLIEPASATLFPTDVLKFGKSVATLDGSIILKLKDKEASKWNALAP